MLAPADPCAFDTLLAAARLEALQILRSFLHAPIETAAVARERRLAASAILRLAPPPQAAAFAAPAPSRPTPMEAPAAFSSEMHPPVRAQPTGDSPRAPAPAAAAQPPAPPRAACLPPDRKSVV